MYTLRTLNVALQLGHTTAIRSTWFTCLVAAFAPRWSRLGVVPLFD
jgi:hypothetical protein